MLIALAVPLSEDLRPLSALLYQRGINHRLFEREAKQVIAVADQQAAELVQAWYKAWRSGELQLELSKVTATQSKGQNRFLSYPLVSCLIALTAVVFVATYLLGLDAWTQALTFLPFEMTHEGARVLPRQGEYWRLITPALLHFSWLHLVFNALWLWEFGRRIEAELGGWQLLTLVIAIAAFSNQSQFLVSHSVLFGGMSGVVYGLLGFCWVAPLIHREWRFQPARGVMVFMLIWLVAGITGVITALSGTLIANTAHVSGLIGGVLLALVYGLVYRLRPRQVSRS